MVTKIIAHVGECASSYLVNTYRKIVILGSRDRQQEIDSITDIERAKYHESYTLHVLELYHKYYAECYYKEEIVGEIAHIHKLGHHPAAIRLRENQRWLQPEQALFEGGKHMVEAGEMAIDSIGIGIPGTKHGKEIDKTCSYHQLARPQEEHHPQSKCARKILQPQPQKVGGIVVTCPGKQYHQRRKGGIDECYQFGSHKAPQPHAERSATLDFLHRGEIFFQYFIH